MKPENEEEAATSREVVAVVVAATATTTTVVASRSGRSKTPSNFIGRHRLQAAISHLDQQIRMIQDELDELDSIGGPSTVCDETKGPIDVNWERWFGGGSSSRSHRRWI
ncbi:guanine nucleotide-binding protein subunit gamma 2 isoform X2 [Beta vulgaris subsp. vulgaris]|uniref:guanine nucleotide-binding protein subunit gamma 2 isoform X2 n=1 Tax=Beta vulgaris subsp. vulgaris TaxID=3555 RepID=UPI0005402772|nr:guanine nucleotide-binding protein subunit gamma 2 isoform X2 [Beta vulgaris subsp. vulgaris]